MGDTMSFDVKDQKECWDYTQDKMKDLMEQIADDFRVYLGDQYTDKEKSALSKKGKPSLVINVAKKPCDLLSGFQRQNWADLSCLPIEGADEVQADVYTQLFKWIFSSQNGSHYVSQAFDDAVICGVGWVAPEIGYDRDLAYGDVRILRESPMSIMPDPATNNADLSDCMYILRHAWMSKTRAKSLFPELSDLIDKCGMGTSMGEENAPRDTRNMVRILENWRKVYSKKKTAMHLLTGEMIDIEDDTVLEGQENYRILDLPTSRIELFSTINEQEIVYEGENPHGVSRFPLIPVFGYWIPSVPEWEWRVQGIIRVLKDSQREKNKRRSQLMEAILSMPHGGWFVEKGSMEDYGPLRKAGSTSRVVEYNPGKPKPSPIESPPISGALMELEQLHTADVRELGLNPDLLGIVGEKGAPAALGAMRQKQGITAVQMIFDNLAMAKKSLGRYLIDLTRHNWDNTKVERIIGSMLPFDFASSGEYFDVAVDELVDSPSYRMANFMVLQQMAQQGFPIPPELMIEMAPCSPEMKKKILAGMQAAAGVNPDGQIPPAGAPGEVPPEIAKMLAGSSGGDITQGQSPTGE